VNTVGENIADNGGLREASKALEKHVQRHGQLERLPYVSQYSPQQLFFLSYANVSQILIHSFVPSIIFVQL